MHKTGITKRILAGLMGAVMSFGLVAQGIPVSASAANDTVLKFTYAGKELPKL